MDDNLLSVDQNYMTFADRIFNKYKDIYSKQNEERENMPGKN